MPLEISKTLFSVSYGKLPMGWPPDWVYKSAFGEDWEKLRLKNVRNFPLGFVRG